MTRQIDQAVNQAITEGVFPSAQLLVVKDGRELHHAAYGGASLKTAFDVASLTKPIATVTLAMILSSEGSLDLETRVAEQDGAPYRGWHKEITPLHLLNHSSGLPAWRPYYQEVPADAVGTLRGKEIITRMCRNEGLEYRTGTKSIYSDIGIIILGDVIEHMLDKPLNKLFEEKIAVKLGLNSTFFVPLNLTPARGGNQFAPTEDCPWRKKVLCGEVHDQNCYAMGGVAAHAGLFSNTTDIKKFADTILNCYRGRGNFIPQKTIQKFLSFEPKLTDEPSAWLLGWEHPHPPNTQPGKYFSAKTVGHLGYTGCSIWIDLEQNFYTILLTNRIHPTTENRKIALFRPKIQDMIYETLIKHGVKS